MQLVVALQQSQLDVPERFFCKHRCRIPPHPSKRPDKMLALVGTDNRRQHRFVH